MLKLLTTMKHVKQFNDFQINELFGIGKSKYKKGDVVYFNGEKEPRKIVSSFKEKGKTCYHLSDPKDDNGNYSVNGGYSATEEQLKSAQ